MRRARLLLVLLFACVGPLLGADYQDQSTQTVRVEFLFFDVDGNKVTDSSADFRGYIIGADSSLAANQIDFTFDTACDSCWYVSNLARDESYNIYRIDGADSLYRSGVRIPGRLVGLFGSDSSSIAANAIYSAHIVDYGLQTADYDTGSVTALSIATNAVTTTEILDATVTGDDISDQSLKAADFDSSETIPFQNVRIHGRLYADSLFSVSASGPSLILSTTEDSSATFGADTLHVPHDLLVDGDAYFGDAVDDSVYVQGTLQAVQTVQITTNGLQADFWDTYDADLMEISSNPADSLLVSIPARIAGNLKISGGNDLTVGGEASVNGDSLHVETKLGVDGTAVVQGNFTTYGSTTTIKGWLQVVDAGGDTFTSAGGDTQTFTVTAAASDVVMVQWKSSVGKADQTALGVSITASNTLTVHTNTKLVNRDFWYMVVRP